jgi:hypothetical protein
MSWAKHLALAAVTWLPLVALLVLIGLTVGWWATALALVPFAIFAVLAVRAVRELQNRPAPDPAAVREELKELDRRAVPWIKGWAFGILGFAALGVVLLLIAAFAARR